MLFHIPAATSAPLMLGSDIPYSVLQDKRGELSLEQAAQKSELKAERDASFHQRQFMGMVSHEFRTPLAVISGSLENLLHLEPDNSDRMPRYTRSSVPPNDRYN